MSRDWIVSFQCQGHCGNSTHRHGGRHGVACQTWERALDAVKEAYRMNNPAVKPLVHKRVLENA